MRVETRVERTVGMEQGWVKLHLERREGVVCGLDTVSWGRVAYVWGGRTKVSLATKTPPSNGVSLGPHMRASQVKKSDSDMGPVGGGGGGGWGGARGRRLGRTCCEHAVWRALCAAVGEIRLDVGDWGSPPAVSCLYSVIRRRSAVELLADARALIDVDDQDASLRRRHSPPRPASRLIFKLGSHPTLDTAGDKVRRLRTAFIRTSQMWSG